MWSLSHTHTHTHTHGGWGRGPCLTHTHTHTHTRRMGLWSLSHTHTNTHMEDGAVVPVTLSHTHTRRMGLQSLSHSHTGSHRGRMGLRSQSPGTEPLTCPGSLSREQPGLHCWGLSTCLFEEPSKCLGGCLAQSPCQSSDDQGQGRRTPGEDAGRGGQATQT